MTAKAKFLFDLDFAPGADAAELPIAQAEHAALLAEVENKSFKDGYAAAEKDAIAAAAVAFERIGDALDRLARGLADIEQKLEKDAIELAVAVARKLAPELVAREPFAEIAALATDCFRQLSAAPHVMVRVNDALHQTARERLDEIARTRGFEGRIVVVAEPDIAAGDCRIEWADGGLTRDQAKTESAIANAVARYLGVRMTVELPELGDINQ